MPSLLLAGGRTPIYAVNFPPALSRWSWSVSSLGVPAELTGRFRSPSFGAIVLRRPRGPRAAASRTRRRAAGSDPDSRLLASGCVIFLRLRCQSDCLLFFLQPYELFLVWFFFSLQKRSHGRNLEKGLEENKNRS